MSARIANEHNRPVVHPGAQQRHRLVAAVARTPQVARQVGWIHRKPAAQDFRRTPTLAVEPLPQTLKNVALNGASRPPLEDARVRAAIREGEARLAGSGRLLIRASGTEPVIRVMAEGEDEALISAVVGDIVGVIEHACR